LLALLVAIATCGTAFAFRFIVPFLPGRTHERITISLPFAAEDDARELIPMGETINHPDSPHGHPGIDFSWDHDVPIIASAAGIVTKIQRHEDGRTWDVEVVTGDYAVRYTELESYNPELKKGQRIAQGSWIGQPGHPLDLPDGNRRHYSIHWEFDYDTFWVDRLCPMTYFDDDSRQRIERIWARSTWQHKAESPDICSGFYYGRDE
jgi:murein DD-endopeptidase MepM/ murein hydrolase activator NlpD